MDSSGITAFGCYLPAVRINRATIAAAVSWIDPGLAGAGKGEKAVCNWDEDSLTMAVEAARDCVNGATRTINSVALATSTAFYADRSNAALVVEALDLGAKVGAMEFSGSRRAATSAAIMALGQAALGATTLVVGSDRRVAKPGSAQDFSYGHGAAAVSVGAGDGVIARYLAHDSMTADIVDQYRPSGGDVDYVLEERWAREEGWLKTVPATVASALAKAKIAPEQVRHVVIPAPASLAKAVAQKCKLPIAALADPLDQTVGDTGVAHPLLMLTHVLASAAPKDIILVCGYGQGCDALVFEVMPAITTYRTARGPLPTPQIVREDNYLRYLSYNGQVAVHTGMRAEHDKRTAHSTAFRKRDMVTGLIGGKCKVCGTVQFPRARACVNPNCREFDTQEPCAMRETKGFVKTFTEDWLAYSPSPPLIYGNIQFESGANIMMELGDVRAGEIAVGTAMKMAFRIKDTDELRSFRRYFWKAIPSGEKAK